MMFVFWVANAVAGGSVLLVDTFPQDFPTGLGSGTVPSVEGLVLEGGARSGNYRSRVFDAGGEATLAELTWTPEGPYGKPLPDGGVVESQYAFATADLTEAALVLHFDKQAPGEPTASPIRDGSVHGLVVNGGDDAGWTEGVSGTAYEDRDDSYLWVDVDDKSPLQFGESDFTWAYWVRSTQDCSPAEDPPFANNRVHLGIEVTSPPGTHLWLGCRSDARIVCPEVLDSLGRIGGTFGAGKEFFQYCGELSVHDGNWHHVALVKEGHKDAKISIFVDGRAAGSTSANFGTAFTFPNATEWAIGAFSGGFFGAEADFDEVVVVMSAWTVDQVRDAYRRHRLSLNLRVRACDAADCSDEPAFSAWVSDESAPGQVPAATIPDLQGRYFQYEVGLATDDALITPRLLGVSLAVVPEDGDSGLGPDLDTPEGSDTGGSDDPLPSAWFCSCASVGWGWPGLIGLGVLALLRRRTYSLGLIEQPFDKI